MLPANRFGGCTFFLGLLFLAGEAFLSAQPPPKRDDLYKFSVETKLVVLHATVMDRNKHLVTNLTRDNFKVFENDVEQRIKEFKREDIPVSVGIVVDNSGSMRDKRPKVNAAALVFVKTSNPQDEVFIVNFNDEAFLDKDFTSNLEELKEGLEKIDARGGTALHEDRKSTRLNSSHSRASRMPSSA